MVEVQMATESSQKSESGKELLSAANSFSTD